MSLGKPGLAKGHETYSIKNIFVTNVIKEQNHEYWETKINILLGYAEKY